MHSEYVEERNGGYYLAGVRISLDSVICAFNRGESPEQILEAYPLLSSLGRVYGAIAFYLDHRADIDQHLASVELKFEADAIPLSEENPELWLRIEAAREQIREGRLDPVSS